MSGLNHDFIISSVTLHWLTSAPLTRCFIFCSDFVLARLPGSCYHTHTHTHTHTYLEGVYIYCTIKCPFCTCRYNKISRSDSLPACLSLFNSFYFDLSYFPLFSVVNHRSLLHCFTLDYKACSTDPVYHRLLAPSRLLSQTRTLTWFSRANQFLISLIYCYGSVQQTLLATCHLFSVHYVSIVISYCVILHIVSS